MAVLIAVGSGWAWPGAVGAAVEIGHAGNIGRHGLLDSRVSPGVTCRFAPPLVWSLGETWIQVRPPVIFAFDATDRVEQQLVGWRAVVHSLDPASGAWQIVAEGETEQAIASDNRSAQFNDRSPATQFFLGYGAYLVTTDLFWYDRRGPGEDLRLAGQAEYQVEHYAVAVRDRVGTHPLGVSSGCRLGP